MIVLTGRRVGVIGGLITVLNVNKFMEQIQLFSDEKNLCIQVFNAERICGKAHLHSAVLHGLRASDQGTLSTHSLSMEILLYASGERQVKTALKKMGIVKGENKIALVCIDLGKRSKTFLRDCLKQLFDEFQIIQDSSVLNFSDDKLHSFGITDEELKTVKKQNRSNIILEKIALVDIIK